MHNEDVILSGNNLQHQIDLQKRFEKLEIIKKFKGNVDKVWRQAGTLGGGNHFIELCLDENDQVWIMLHSGSRNIGKEIADTAITTAKEIAAARLYNLIDLDLAWLEDGTKEFNDYKEGLLWSQEYASLNRSIMMSRVIETLAQILKKDVLGTQKAINCHHNYANIEDHLGEKIWITRKGAVSARTGELGIIPGSMGAKSFIVRGRGHPESYSSCSHGAGRKMSRGQAKKSFTIDDLKKQTMGVECRKDKNLIDEIPGAYKDIEAVMAAQSDLVEIVHTLKQIVCIKG
jgi:tRNA-splicing ligase RtcB